MFLRRRREIRWARRVRVIEVIRFEPREQPTRHPFKSLRYTYLYPENGKSHFIIRVSKKWIAYGRGSHGSYIANQ